MGSPEQDAAFLALIKAHGGIIHKVCRLYRDAPEDREDLYQEILFQLWKAHATFRGEAKVSSWMYRIALNTAIATFRKAKSPVHYHDELPDAPADPAGTADEEERLFALEVVVDRALGRTRALGDAVHVGGLVALLTEDGRGGVHDRLPLLWALSSHHVSS